MNKLAWTLKDLFVPRTIKSINSPVNGLIKVILVLNRPRLMVGGMVQSGGLLVKLWQKAIQKIKLKKYPVKKALIIGLGCGDSAMAINQYYKNAQITGVEIDPHIIDMAKCYFNLSTVKNLNIVIQDGIDYVQKKVKAKKPPQFDLIIIDAYLGKKMPQIFRTKKFLSKVNKLLSKRGTLIVNHLFFGSHKKKAPQLIKTLDSFFSDISLKRTPSNLIIYARH